MILCVYVLLGLCLCVCVCLCVSVCVLVMRGSLFQKVHKYQKFKHVYIKKQIFAQGGLVFLCSGGGRESLLMGAGRGLAITT